MTWIQTTTRTDADADLARRYDAVYAHYPPEYENTVATVVNPQNNTSDSVVSAHSLIPAAMEHAMSTFGVLLSDQLPLSRRQHEMIATLVSALNSCFY